jgi:hypothetical protein
LMSNLKFDVQLIFNLFLIWAKNKDILISLNLFNILVF